MMIANAIGNAASRPMLPSTSHVSLPSQHDRVHHLVARWRVGREPEQDPDAKIEAVEQHVKEDPDAEDDRPNQDEI
jgi:hypothetical protein